MQSNRVFPILAIAALVALHAGAVAFAGALPDAWAPALAATVYLPLWPLSAVGLPVFGPAPSGGWPGPNTAGWVVLLVAWSVMWAIPVAVVARWRRRPAPGG